MEGKGRGRSGPWRYLREKWEAWVAGGICGRNGIDTSRGWRLFEAAGMGRQEVTSGTPLGGGGGGTGTGSVETYIIEDTDKEENMSIRGIGG